MPAATPRRGQPGFAEAARRAGGDPLLQEARERRLRSVEASDDPTRERTPERGSRRRRRGVVERVGATRVPLSGGVTVDDGAGLLLGIFAWAVALQYFRGGMPQVREFLAAKFLNKTG